ncbi:MAG: hypothetical protein KBA51_04065 [Kiritimatiellae bacterium]|nr:hypothetical protein [Kiritimatiellia bacterium]
METVDKDKPPVHAMPSRRWIGWGLGVAVVAGLCALAGLETHQIVATSVFSSIIIGTLLFWEFRLAIAFFGVAVLIFTQSLTVPHFVESASLPVILFLVGMMIVVGALRDFGFFTWVIQLILSIPKMTGLKFMALTATSSALLACVVDEVTSIIFISTLIFQVCQRLKTQPAPFLMICVMCTNVGSSGTMMGNPVGIYIGTQAHLTFGDFMGFAFPVMLAALAATVGVTLLWFRRQIAEFDAAMRDRQARHLSLVPQVNIPHGRGVALLAGTVALLAIHHELERWLGLQTNSILLVAPLVCSGAVMLIRPDRARHYVEREVDWWTLLFFLVLFAIAGTLEYTGVTTRMAEAIAGRVGRDLRVLVPTIMAMSAIGSAFVDNVIFVAAFAPVIHAMEQTMAVRPLWWALLFGACFGGNITLVGSTANIVALGLLDKHSHVKIRFMDWLKIGFISALAASLVGVAALLIFKPGVPREDQPPAAEASAAR